MPESPSRVAQQQAALSSGSGGPGAGAGIEGSRSGTPDATDGSGWAGWAMSAAMSGVASAASAAARGILLSAAYICTSPFSPSPDTAYSVRGKGLRGVSVYDA